MGANLDKLKRKKVSQPNSLIESPYAQEFTANEIKLFEIAVADCKVNDMELFKQKKNKTYRFSNTELAKLLNTSPSIISQSAERIADNIMKKYISLKNILSDGSVEFEKISIMPYSKYKDGVFEFDINFRMIPLLININQPYTEFYLHYLLSLSSSYAIKLYKLLYQYKNIGHRKFTVEEIKNQFGIIDKYTQYTDFRKYIINPSIKQINEKTNLNVDYTEIKFGRKVDKLEFTFELKKIQLPIVKSSEIRDTFSNDKVSEVLNIANHIESELSTQTKALITKFTQEKGVDYVEASITYAKKNAKSNLDKYLSDTLTNGWAEVEVKKIQNKKTHTSQKLQNIKQEQTKKDQQKEQASLNKSMVEHEWSKLLDKDKMNYIEYATFIFSKQSAKLERFSSVEESLHLCVYAVTNQKTYDRVLEGYIINVLNISLDINDKILKK